MTATTRDSHATGRPIPARPAPAGRVRCPSLDSRSSRRWRSTTVLMYFLPLVPAAVGGPAARPLVRLVRQCRRVRPAGDGPQRRDRDGGPPRPRLRRVLRDRGVHRTPTATRRSAGTDFPFFPMLFVGAAVAAIFGILLGAPTLRLRGDYLAIMTLGLRRDRADRLPEPRQVHPRARTGSAGSSGRSRCRCFGPFSAISPFNYFLVMAVIVTITMILMYRLQDSRIGRAWNAIREDELAASANGINTVTTKLLAFSLGATTVRPGGRLQCLEAHDRVAGPVPVHGFVHGPRDGDPRRHGQHLGRGRRRVRRLQHPGGRPEADQRRHRDSRDIRPSISVRST